ncbi:MAG: nucleotidyltransferase domain-containing protein [Candidatus Margulisbacteria bacterium]|nr:nucleotidyltransferase domain-containing protein [Candidatus Margulisiibacteriota bacterium]
MKASFENDRRLQDILSRILKVSRPDKIVLFGSRAGRASRRLSDFDIALFGKVDLPRVKAELEEAQTLLKIDLISFDTLKNIKLKNKILEEGVVLYERKI